MCACMKMLMNKEVVKMMMYMTMRSYLKACLSWIALMIHIKLTLLVKRTKILCLAVMRAWIGLGSLCKMSGVLKKHLRC